MTLHFAVTVACAAGGVAFVAHEARELIRRQAHGEVLPKPDKDCRLMRELPDDETGEWHLGSAP